MWIGGALLWFVAQVLEASAWGWWGIFPSEKSQYYVVKMSVEELFEMAGSTLFLLTLLKTHQSVRWRSSSPNRTGPASPGGSE